MLQTYESGNDARRFRGDPLYEYKKSGFSDPKHVQHGRSIQLCGGKGFS